MLKMEAIAEELDQNKGMDLDDDDFFYDDIRISEEYSHR